METNLTQNSELIGAINTYLGTTNAPQSQKNLLLSIARDMGLNPLRKEIYLVGYNNKWDIIISYLSYLKIAERDPNFGVVTTSSERAEWVVFDAQGNLSAVDTIKSTARIKFKDGRPDSELSIYHNEFAKKDRDGKINYFWKTMAGFMLEKVAISILIRRTFPELLSGTYSEFEVEPVEGQSMGDVTPRKCNLTNQVNIMESLNAAKTAADFQKLIDEHRESPYEIKREIFHQLKDKGFTVNKDTRKVTESDNKASELRGDQDSLELEERNELKMLEEELNELELLEEERNELIF